MSKSKGNVVDPMDIVRQYGADTLRIYVLFMGDYTAATPWSDDSVKGCKRFLDRVAGLTDIMDKKQASDGFEIKMNKTIKKVTNDIEAMKFNTAIASMMALINDIYAEGTISKADLSVFLRLLAPFAPHIAEEMWSYIGGDNFISVAPWPEYDESKTVDKTVEIVAQVNGKIKAKMVIAYGEDKEKVLADAKQQERVIAAIGDKKIVKEIYVPNKLVNIVVK